MADLINLTIDGRAVQAPAQMLLIDAAKAAGIEVPAFCYYEGLTLQAACRMCLVEVEKMPKMMTACTLPVSEGMVVLDAVHQIQAERENAGILGRRLPRHIVVYRSGGYGSTSLS
jgi:NADH-quinone oxidoreductase subunit G